MTKNGGRFLRRQSSDEDFFCIVRKVLKLATHFCFSFLKNLNYVHFHYCLLHSKLKTNAYLCHSRLAWIKFWCAAWQCKWAAQAAVVEGKPGLVLSYTWTRLTAPVKTTVTIFVAHPELTRVRSIWFLLFEIKRVLVYNSTLSKLSDLYILYFFLQNVYVNKKLFKKTMLRLNNYV